LGLAEEGAHAQTFTPEWRPTTVVLLAQEVREARLGVAEEGGTPLGGGILARPYQLKTGLGPVHEYPLPLW
jgi:hypothetical protein